MKPVSILNNFIKDARILCVQAEEQNKEKCLFIIKISGIFKNPVSGPNFKSNNNSCLFHPRPNDFAATIRHTGEVRARSEAFQRYPGGRGTKMDTGLRRGDVCFSEMELLTLGSCNLFENSHVMIW
jgi:hypothetical protein